MGRIKRKKEDLKKVKDIISEERKEVAASLPPMVRDTGGSIAGLSRNKSLYFKKWVNALQERNIFIGKDYIQPAKEYNTESQMVGEPTVTDLSNEMKNTLNKGAEEFKSDAVDSNTDAAADFLKDKNSVEEETLPEDQTPFKEYATEAENDFIDITIIENLTKDLENQIDEDIEKVAREKLKEYHEDPDYVPKIDVFAVIKESKGRLLGGGNSDQKLIE